MILRFCAILVVIETQLLFISSWEPPAGSSTWPFSLRKPAPPNLPTAQSSRPSDPSEATSRCHTAAATLAERATPPSRRRRRRRERGLNDAWKHLLPRYRHYTCCPVAAGAARRSNMISHPAFRQGCSNWIMWFIWDAWRDNAGIVVDAGNLPPICYHSLRTKSQPR